MSLSGPRVISGRRKLLKATLIGVSGQFQRVKHQGAGAAGVALTAVASARRVLRASGQAVLALFADGGSDAPTKAGAGFASLGFVAVGAALARKAGSGAASLLTSASGLAITRRQAAGAAALALLASGAAHAQMKGGGSAGLSTSATGGATVVPFPDFAPLFMRVVPDHAGNPSVTPSIAFAPGDIDTVNNRIYLPTAAFGAFGTYAQTKGTPVDFVNSGGALPATIADASKQYFLSPEGPAGWYGVYPEPNATDYLTTPGGLADDTVYPGQNFASLVNKAVLATQGSGTHTVRIKAAKLCSAVVNTLASKPAYNFEALDIADWNTFFEIHVDAQGHSYLKSQRICRDLLKGGPNYQGMGKTFFQKGSPPGVTAKPELGGKRSIVMFAVIYADMTDEFGVARGCILPAGVNTTTGVLTVKNGDPHNMVTGEPAYVRLISGSMPAGLTDGQAVWPRAINTLTGTLHGSAADANGNVNPIIPTTQGSGQFQIVQACVPGDFERMRFIAEISQPNGGQNTLTPRYNGTLPGETSLQMSSDIVMSGSNNGNCGIGGRTSRPIGELKAVRITIPPSAVAPIRADTGQPLASGIYWQSFATGSSTLVRYHDTLAQATAAVGIATSALTGPNACIEFVPTTTVGRCRVESVERPWSVAVIGGDIPLMSWAPPQRVKGVLAIVADYDDPTASLVRVKQYWNGALVSTDDIAGTSKGLTAAATAGVLGSLLNSAASHVAWEGRLYDFALGSSTGEITGADIAPVNNWLMAKYGIA